MKEIETESSPFICVLDERLMELLINIQPKVALCSQESVPFARGCDGSCSGCSSCSGAEGVGW